MKSNIMLILGQIKLGEEGWKGRYLAYLQGRAGFLVSVIEV